MFQLLRDFVASITYKSSLYGYGNPVYVASRQRENGSQDILFSLRHCGFLNSRQILETLRVERWNLTPRFASLPDERRNKKFTYNSRVYSINNLYKNHEMKIYFIFFRLLRDKLGVILLEVSTEIRIINFSRQDRTHNHRVKD